MEPEDSLCTRPQNRGEMAGGGGMKDVGNRNRAEWDIRGQTELVF